MSRRQKEFNAHIRSPEFIAGMNSDGEKGHDVILFPELLFVMVREERQRSASLLWSRFYRPGSNAADAPAACLIQASAAAGRA